jgi:glycine cleavage system pyridoxal-binding protein P
MNPQNVHDLKSHTGIATERPGSFQSRHIGPDASARDQMLAAIGVPSLDALIDQTIPPDIRLGTSLDLPAGDSEHEYLRRLRGIAARNRNFRSFIRRKSRRVASNRCSTSRRSSRI